jgi:hypothetical protein
MEQPHEKVLAFIKQTGPVLPVQVAKMLSKETYYAGAILSDLLARKAIKISSAKIGGSPVYYLPDQQERLSILYGSLPQREKEAYDHLKEKQFLKDTEVEPVMRVALRALKDFAIPVEKNNTLTWKWYLNNELETPASTPLRAEAPLQPVQAPLIERQPALVQQKLQKPTKKQTTTDEFSGQVERFLEKNNVQILEKISQRKNKEVIAVVRVPSSVGELEMLVIAKNKAKITKSDISLAHEKGQTKKLPTLFLTTAELNKSLNQHIEKNVKGYVIVRKL